MGPLTQMSSRNWEWYFVAENGRGGFLRIRLSSYWVWGHCEGDIEGSEAVHLVINELKLCQYDFLFTGNPISCPVN